MPEYLPEYFLEQTKLHEIAVVFPCYTHRLGNKHILEEVKITIDDKCHSLYCLYLLHDFNI